MAHGQRSGEMAARAASRESLGRPGQRPARGRGGFGGRREALVEQPGEVLRAHEQVDLEEALETPRFEVACADEDILAVAHERLRVKHRGMLEDPHARVEQRLVVESLRGRACPVVRLRRHEEADPYTPAGGILDPPDHRLVGDVGIDHVERLARAFEQLRDGGRDRAIAPWSVVQHGRRHGT